MEGVTTLNTITDSGLHSSAVWVVIIALLVFAIFVAIDIWNNIRAKKFLDAVGMFSVVCVCVFVMIFTWNDSQYSETRYIVSVDDSVSFNDFQQVYEIVEKDGDNYVVRVIGDIKSIDNRGENEE